MIEDSTFPVNRCSLPPALPPPGTAPAAWSSPASAWAVWTGSSGAGAGAGTRPDSGGSTGIAAGDTGGTGVTGDTGTTAAAAATPRFADPTDRRGREDRPPQTRAGTASWPACVLWGEEEEEVVGFGGGRGEENEGRREDRREEKGRLEADCDGGKRGKKKGKGEVTWRRGQSKRQEERVQGGRGGILIKGEKETRN